MRFISGYLYRLAFAALVGSVVAFSAISPASAQQIVVQGSQRVDAETIRSYFGGTDEGRINQAVKDLYATGLFADDPGADAMLDVVVPRGDRPRRESVAVRQVTLADAIVPLLELDGAAPGVPPASVSARWWSAATVVALDLIARGHLIPAVTTGQGDRAVRG